MAVQYDSNFSGQHNDEYDTRLTIIEEWKNNFLNTVYPVGSIYMSVNNVSPSTLFGGTWAPIYSRMLIGAGGLNEANTHNSFGTTAAGTLQFAAGEMGGELQHTLTTAEMPSHSHSGYVEFGTSANLNIGPPGQYNQINFTYHLDGYHQTFVENTGGSGPHNNMPPYLGVYMWKRTA